MKVIYLTNDYIYINENNKIVKKELSYEKGLVTSSLGYNHILNINFKLPKSIEKDMLEIEAEKYIYTEDSLDYTKEYKINYVFKEYDDYYNVEAFVVEINVLKRIYEKFLHIYKHIDFISAKPLIFKNYYDIVNLEPKNDAFIYLDENEAFLSCFEKGEFVFVKSITKLSTLIKQLDISIEELKTILSEKGLNEENYEDEEKEKFELIESFFSQFFMKVSNLINYSINYYGFEKIDRIFFYSSFEIKDLYEHYTNFWDLSGIKFEKYDVKSEYDAFDYTASIYNSMHCENENENFSIFPRPIPFYKTKIGIIALLTAACFSVIGADAYFKYQTISKQQKIILTIKKKIAKNKRKSDMLKKVITEYQKNINTIKQQNEALQEQIKNISQKIAFLKEIQKKAPIANEMANLINKLKQYKLKLLSFNKKNFHTDIILISKFRNSSNIAKLMKDLYDLGYKNIVLTEIENNEGIYISKVSYDG